MERLKLSGCQNCHVNQKLIDGVLVYQAELLELGRILEREDADALFDTDEASVCAAFELAIPDGGAMMAVYQHKTWWLRPGFPRVAAEIPQRTQLLLWEQDGQFLCLLAACDGVLRCDVQGAARGVRLTLSANGCAGDGKPHPVAAFARGTDPYSCIHAMVRTIAAEQGRPHILRENKQYPGMFRKLGWCTWDAFYHKVNEQDIFAKLEEFRSKQVPIGWLLIDDGWSTANYETRKLRGLAADPVKFPQGLAHTISRIKESYGIPLVGVWHALMGYWTGIEKDSSVYAAWKQRLLVRNGDDYVLPPEEQTIFEFYDAWHAQLEGWGIDFLKVDGQGSGSLYYKKMADYATSAGGYLRGLERSADAHFQGNLVNCMGMAPECMWLREHSTVSRSSDDFVPNVPHGFREHALQNGFNSLLQGAFFWGDWDMFWSCHEESRQNSVLRSVSGGPVYVSDGLEQTDPANILPLVGWDGEVIACDGIGVPTQDCLLRDPLRQGAVFKLFNTMKDGFAVAAFHINGHPTDCVGSLRTQDIPGLEGKQWLVYSHFAHTVAILTDDKPVLFTLAPDDVEFLLVLPKEPYGQVIGDPEKYGAAYVLLEQRTAQTGLSARVAPCGSLSFYTEKPVAQVRIDGAVVPFTGENGCWKTEGREKTFTLEIDYQ